MLRFRNAVVDASALPAEKQFLKQMILQRMNERVMLDEREDSLKITLIPDSRFQSEEYQIEMEKDHVKISGGDFRGLTYGAGKFLRSLDYSDNDFGIKPFKIQEKPKASLRQCYFARHFFNYYHRAPEELIQRYIEDLALWGFNSIHIPVVPVVNLNDDPEAEEFKNRVAAFRKTASFIKRLDMFVSSCTVSNQSFLNTPEALRAIPETDPKRGNLGFNICPAKPGGLEYILKTATMILEQVKDIKIDLFRFFPFDEGGCECDVCRPWGGNGYLRLIEKIKTLIQKYYPEAKFIVATWTFHEDEWELLYRYLETHDWIDYIMADSHDDYPRYPLEVNRPGHSKLITFPEISMWGRIPWGGYGATPLPQRFEKLFHQVQGHVDGCIQYSEGIFEDINKIVVQNFYMNENVKAEDTLREYACYEFPGIDSEKFVELSNLLESNQQLAWQAWQRKEKDSVLLNEMKIRATKALELVKELNEQLLPSMKNSWRWRQFICRCVIDFEIITFGNADSKRCIAAMEELIKMYFCFRNPKDFPPNATNIGAIRPPLSEKVDFTKEPDLLEL